MCEVIVDCFHKKYKNDIVLYFLCVKFPCFFYSLAKITTNYIMSIRTVSILSHTFKICGVNYIYNINISRRSSGNQYLSRLANNSLKCYIRRSLTISSIQLEVYNAHNTISSKDTFPQDFVVILEHSLQNY